jgi:hypothetical protein
VQRLDLVEKILERRVVHGCSKFYAGWPAGMMVG